MSARLVANFASAADANPQVIPLTGKTDGRDLFVFFTVAATVTLPANWVELASVSPGGVYFTKLWRLPAASNTSAVTQLSVALNGPRAISAIIWEDDLDTGTTPYVALTGPVPTADNPALFGTGLHTFASRNEVFALFNAAPVNSTTANTFDLVSYDTSFTDFGDSGSPLATDRNRVFAANRKNVAMSNNGVTATANGPRNTADASAGVGGLFAYNTLVPTGNPPVNTVAPAITTDGSPATGETVNCSTGTWTGDTTIAYAYQWRRNGASISGATSNTYVLALADEGQSITCLVTATNSVGSASATSNTINPATSGKLTIAQENALTGNPSTEWAITGAGDTANLGFCREFSLNVGSTAHFACHGSGTVIDIYRIGWYQGLGWRKVATLTNTATVQANPTIIAGSNGATTCTGWSDTASWTIPANATPGLYVGVYRNLAGNNASYIPFVVRDDARIADIMYKTSDTTWALAYNYYGTPASPLTGASLYGSGGPLGDITTRVHATTYHKPIITRAGVPQTYWLACEAPMIRFLERNGYDVTYTASKDWRGGAGAPTLAACQLYLSCGHDEYWSQGMRDAWLARRNAGKHLLFMSGNEVFWRTRFDTAGDVMWCFKDTMPGPGAHVAGAALDPVTWTGSWKDTRAANNVTRAPENTLTGTDFRMNGVNDKSMVIASGSAEASHPFWRGTSVVASGLTSGVGIIGFEADEAKPTQPSESVKRLASTAVNATGIYADDNGENYGGTKTNMDWGIVSQRDASGAVTVGFGTCQWPWGLDATHDRGANIVSTAIQQATVNLLRDLGVSPATITAGLSTPTPASLNAYGAIPGGSLSIRFHINDGGQWKPLQIGVT